jgi:hypothetical protein
MYTFALCILTECPERISYRLITTVNSVSAYRKPYLFILHFSSVEVMKLSDSSFTHSQDDSDATATASHPERTYIELNNPRFLGN